MIKKVNINPAESLMVGNHADKDGNAEKAGIDTILLSDYLINYNNKKRPDLAIRAK